MSTPQPPPGGGPESARGAQPWAQPPAPAGRGTSGLAIAAFVVGLLGGAIVGAVMGIAALLRMRRSGKGGRGFAIAGIALSAAWTLIIPAVVLLVLSIGPERDGSGRITEAGTMSVRSIRVGDCIQDLEVSGNDLEFTVTGVPCGEPHEGEAFEKFELRDGRFPGQRFVDSEAERRCDRLLRQVSPSAAADPGVELFYYVPTEETWSSDREVVCVADYVRPRRGGLSKAR